MPHLKAKFDIGALVRYNSVIPMYLPQVVSGLGIVTKVGVADLRIYSMTQKKEVIVRGSTCTILSRANPREG